MTAGDDLQKAAAALRDAYRDDADGDTHRCGQNARTAVDYASSAILGPDASPETGAEALGYLHRALALDPESISRRDRLHRQVHGRRRPS